MAKIGLQKVTENSYFYNGFLSIGAYVKNSTIILIDSGNDKTCAKEIYKNIVESGLCLGGIINTHRHPDHCGGNSFLQSKYPETSIFATDDEKCFIEDPARAPQCFCSGAAPFSGLQNKHIAPQKPSIVTHTIAPYKDQTITIAENTLHIITLPGHTPGMIGVITPDNILYSGDALFGQETLDKHPILFYTDIAQTLASFDKLETLNVDACVLYHGGLIHDLLASVRLHREKVLNTKSMILALIATQERSVDLLTQAVMQKCTIPDSIISFVLTQTAIRAYLAILEQENSIEIIVSNGLLYVRTK